MSIISRLLQRISKPDVSTGWQAVVRPGMYVPLQMRRRGSDGKWYYRSPTEEEMQEYVENEAW